MSKNKETNSAVEESKISLDEATKLWLLFFKKHADSWRQNYLKRRNYYHVFLDAETVYEEYQKALASLADLHGKEGQPEWEDAIHWVISRYTLFIARAELAASIGNAP